MITHKINTTSGPLKITIPSDIKEISIGLMADYTPAPGESYSPLEQLSILSGIPLYIDETKPNGPNDFADVCLYDISNLDDIAVFNDTLEVLSIQIKALADTMEMPEAILVPVEPTNVKRWFNRSTNNSKLVKIPKKLNIEPVGAMWLAKDIIKKDFEEFQGHNKPDVDLDLYKPKIESLISVLAAYLYVPVTGEKFNPRKAAQFDEVVRKLPITKALPIARYFFLKYQSSLKGKLKP